MTEKIPVTLSGVSESSLLTLYIRAMESQRSDAMINDEKAVALVTQMCIFHFRRGKHPVE